MKIGWIGVGVMGTHMASHLMEAGHRLAICSRTPSKCMPLVERGATLVESPREAAKGSAAVFTMVGKPGDVEAVTLGKDGALRAMSPGSLLVDMTTSTPSLAAHIAAQASALGVHAVDAPVSGGDIGAKAGTLSIMCGGSVEGMQKARPLLEKMGRNILHMGGPGAGQHTKSIVCPSLSLLRQGSHSEPTALIGVAVCNQILACSNMIGMTESLIYAHRAGLDANQVIVAIGAGAASSWAINNLGPRVVKRDFAPGFMIEHMTKGVCLAPCRGSLFESIHVALDCTICRSRHCHCRGRSHGSQSSWACSGTKVVRKLVAPWAW